MGPLIPFSFESQDVRVIDQDGEPWFVLADVCRVLDLTNPSKAASALDDDEKATLTNSEGQAGQGAQTFLIINESGLWSLVLRSRKPQAKRFRKWITGEVIPSIRKHGHYSAVETAPNMTDGIAAVRETRLSFNKVAARQMWMKMGLPVVPAMLAVPQQTDLFASH